MIKDPPRLDEIELQPVLSKGELVVDNWWRPDAPRRRRRCIAATGWRSSRCCFRWRSG